MNHSGIPIFRYGELRLTKGVDKLISHHAELLPYIAKHITGDWGVLALDDKQSNDEALQFGGRLLSVYMFTCLKSEKFG